jgi:hypothetical protein
VSSNTPPRPIAPLAAATVVTVLGAVLLGGALATRQAWLDRHFLPSFFTPRSWYVGIETSVRAAMALAGAWLVLFARPWIARLVNRAPGAVARVAIAVVLAIVAGEVALRWVHVRPTAWLFAAEEPLRRPDPILGWTLASARVGRNTKAGRVVEYAIDPSGCRVPRLDAPVDPRRPTIVFAGESVMFGEGLTWKESIPAQVGAVTGFQSANLAVHGYGTDQIYLHLKAELPRFRQPVAVVSLFMSALFGRNLEDDRPHLGANFVWTPPERRGRLQALAMLLVPYRTDADVAEGTLMTQQVLRATADLARARGAGFVLVVPQFGPEDGAERAIRRRVLDEARIPYTYVEVGGDWRLAWDSHPNAQGARQVAAAIASALAPVLPRIAQTPPVQ